MTFVKHICSLHMSVHNDDAFPDVVRKQYHDVGYKLKKSLHITIQSIIVLPTGGYAEMTQQEDRLNDSVRFSDLMMFLAVLCWGISFPVAKIAMTEWQGFKFFFLAGRFWLAFVILIVFVAKFGNWRLLAAHLKPALWTGGILAVAFGFQYAAFSSSAGKVAFLTALASVFVPIVMWVAERKRIDIDMWIGLIVATGGASLVLYQGRLAMDWAALWALIGAMGLAAYIVVLSHYKRQQINGEKRYQAVPYATMTFLVVATITTILSLVSEVATVGLPPWSGRAVGGLIFMAVVATAGAFLLQTKFQNPAKPERAALIFTFESPLAGLFASILLGETFSAQMVVGAMLIFGAVVYVEFVASVRRSTKTEAPQT